MLKEHELIGAIGIFRQEVRPFTDKQIELVQNFAAQAVIAIENTRLLNELRTIAGAADGHGGGFERHQSSSPGDLEPVFQSMLENAMRICEAKFGTLFLFDGEVLSHRMGTPLNLPNALPERCAGSTDPGQSLDRVMRTNR